MRHRLLIASLVLLFITACGAEPAAAPPTTAPQATQPAPTAAPPTAQATAAQPTAAPSPSAAPAPTAAPPPTVALAPTTVPEPTSAPPTGTLLPAPLYFLRDGQIWRLEADGATLHQLTAEILPIDDYDVALSDGALAYTIIDGA